MIISHKYKFIFIKTSKTGGTSIEVFLSKISGDRDVVTPIYPIVEGHNPKNHKGLFNPLKDFKPTKKGIILFFKNLKRFLFREKFYNHMSAFEIKNRINDEIWNNYYKFTIERNPIEKTISFYKMLKSRGKANCIEDFINKKHFPFDKHLYTLDKKIIVDYFIKYENLETDFQRVLNHLKIKTDHKLTYEKSSKSFEAETIILSNQQELDILRAFEKNDT